MSEFTTFDKILDDAERQEIKRFCENERMKGAVKKVLLFGIYQTGTLKPGETPDPIRNWALSGVFSLQGSVPINNETLGEIVRARGEGIIFLEQAFNMLENLKPIEEKVADTQNPAR